MMPNYWFWEHLNVECLGRKAFECWILILQIWFLICTDLVARGVDFKGVALVINFDLPLSTSVYIHRIGRTGRACREGKVCKVWIGYLHTIIDSFSAAKWVLLFIRADNDQLLYRDLSGFPIEVQCLLLQALTFFTLEDVPRLRPIVQVMRKSCNSKIPTFLRTKLTRNLSVKGIKKAPKEQRIQRSSKRKPINPISK